MPGELGRAGQQDALDAATGRAAPAFAAATTYMALCTADPGKNPANPGAINEVSASGYARQSVAWSAPSAADPSESHNTGVLTFGPFTALPGTVTHCACVTSSSGSTGTMRAKWTLDNSKTPALNESLQFNASGLSLSLD